MSPRGRTRTGSVLARGMLVLLVIGPAPSASHPSHQVKSLRMTLSPGRIELRMRYEVSQPRFASDLRERFDADQNRELSAGERNAMLDYLAVLATEDLKLLGNGVPLAPAVRTRASSGLERDLPSAYPLVLHLLLEYEMPSGGGAHEISLSDAETRWESNFECLVNLDSGVTEIGREAALKPEEPRIFEFFRGRGSFTMRIRIER